jgi:site-specific DNA-methyltransferase (adenine-specific)
MQNTLYTGDNLYILNGMNSESVDLIYLDPPFNSKRTYSAPVGSKSAGASFKDMWSWNDVDESYLEKLVENYSFMVKFIEAIEGIHGKAMMSYITYMTQRIIEMHRVLKSTGSFYLHCDPTASHYLKIILDKIFGKNNFRSEITWKRQTAKKGSQYKRKSYGASSDIILFYTKSDDWFFNIPKIPLNPKELIKKFNKIDEKGRRFRPDRVTLPRVMTRYNLVYEYKKYIPEYGWMMNKEKLEQMDKEGRLYWSKTGKPYRKYFLNDYEGKEVSNMWIDIFIATKKESLGYPTQKPLALLKRIILASSNEGDIIFDPFCGCATACVAAQQLQRKWIGIDIEKQAASILIERLSDDAGLFSDFIHRTDVPERTDIKKEFINQSIKERLFKQQEAKCNACNTEMRLVDFEIDHIIPKSKGGGDYYENYQLLCGNCNRIKGNRPMEYLRMKIKVREELLQNKVTFGG